MLYRPNLRYNKKCKKLRNNIGLVTITRKKKTYLFIIPTTPPNYYFRVQTRSGYHRCVLLPMYLVYCLGYCDNRNYPTYTF